MVLPSINGILIKVYKYLAISGLILGALVGSYFYGHHVGVQSQQVAQEKSVIKTQEKTITITKTQTVIDTKAVEALQKQLDVEKAKTVSLQGKISTLTVQQLQTIKQTNDGKQECVLSKDWLDTYNASVKGVSP